MITRRARAAYINQLLDWALEDTTAAAVDQAIADIEAWLNTTRGRLIWWL